MSLNIVHSYGEAAFSKTGVIFLLLAVLTSGCNPFYSQVTPPPPVTVEFTRVATKSSELQAAPTSAEVIGSEQAIAATVNGQPILLDDFKRELAAFSASETGGDNSDNNLHLSADLQSAVLNRMIDQQIIEQNAQLLGIEISEPELEAAKNTLTAGIDTSLDEWLTINGLSAEQFELTLKQELLTERLFDDRTKNIVPTAEQVRFFFLWVDSETLAENVTQRLQEIGDFTQVSQEEQSYHPENSGGGYMDWFAVGDNRILPPEVESRAFTLESGQIDGPITAASRYYFIKLEEKDSNRLLPKQKYQQKKQAVFAQWLAEQRNSAEIEVYIIVE